MRVVCLLLLLLLGYWVPVPASLEGVTAARLSITIGLTRPPYVDELHSSGFEVEVLRAIFQRMGYASDFIFVPTGRTYEFFEQSDTDALASVSEHRLVDRALSEPYIRYQDVVITLQDNAFELKSLADLAGKSVAAFQTAQAILGPEYNSAIERTRYYIEVPDQRRQVQLLWQQRVDALVIDYNIFRTIAGQQVENPLALVDVFHLLAPVDYGVAFKDEALIPLFNEARSDFFQSEDYQQMLQYYQIRFVLPATQPAHNGAGF